MVLWDWQHLGSTGTQVRSLAWHSGLRIWCCCSCSLCCSGGSNLIPGLELHMPWGSQKEKKKKKRKEYGIVTTMAQVTTVAWVQSLAWELLHAMDKVKQTNKQIKNQA